MGIEVGCWEVPVEAITVVVDKGESQGGTILKTFGPREGADGVAGSLGADGSVVLFVQARGNGGVALGLGHGHMTVGALGKANRGQQGHGSEKRKYFFHLFKDFRI